MVNLNNTTKMMVNRCMELLNAKIAHAQTRHVARRVPPITRARSVDMSALQRERMKTESYEAKKRLSMWEQDKTETQPIESDEDSRLDNRYYKHQDINQRNFDCTWTQFPDEKIFKQKPNIDPDVEAPSLRRRAGERPETAKPYNAEAIDFIKQWDEKDPMINRSRYAKPTNNCNSPTYGTQFGLKKFY